MKNIVTEILGWYGVVAIVLAYTLLSFNLIESNSLTFQGLNLTGAIGIVLISLYKRNLQPAILNMIWAVIAGIALIKMLLWL